MTETDVYGAVGTDTGGSVSTLTDSRSTQIFL